MIEIQTSYGSSKERTIIDEKYIAAVGFDYSAGQYTLSIYMNGGAVMIHTIHDEDIEGHKLITRIFNELKLILEKREYK